MGISSRIHVLVYINIYIIVSPHFILYVLKYLTMHKVLKDRWKVHLNRETRSADKFFLLRVLQVAVASTETSVMIHQDRGRLKCFSSSDSINGAVYILFPYTNCNLFPPPPQPEGREIQCEPFKARFITVCNCHSPRPYYCPPRLITKHKLCEGERRREREREGGRAHQAVHRLSN